MWKILLVEDEATNREVAQVICSAAGHQLTQVTNGQEALEMLENERFDLLLVDVLMPVMDGLTLTERLRADPRWRDVPILGVTARASNADQAEMIRVGMDAVLTKPFRNRALLGAIDALMARPTTP